MEEENFEKQENGDGAPNPAEVTKYRGWKIMPYVIGNETFEKLGALGTGVNLLVYLTAVFHMKSAAAATLLTAYNGTSNLTPLLGAFLSDTYFGRYATIGVASIASFLGMVILTLTAAISKLHPGRCGGDVHGAPCETPSGGQFAVLLCSFLFIAIGAGGIRPCNLAFGADQFDPNTESGRRGVNSFFNWYYFSFTTAMMISCTFIIYVQSNVSWSLGFAIPAILMFLACVCFFLGSRRYVKVKPEGSPITSMAQVVFAACRKASLPVPGDMKRALFDPPHCSSLVSKIPHTSQFRFLDKAAVITPDDNIKPDMVAENPWRLCSLQQVEQTKCVLRIIPIWTVGVIYYVSTVQHSAYVVFEALQSDRRLGGGGFQIPAASFSVFSMATITIWLPVYDRLVVPWVRRITGREGGITQLQRMGVGIVLSVAAMLVAALVEQRRRNTALREAAFGGGAGGAVSSMSSFWLVPQLTIMGLSEAFSLIGQMEFYYKQFPENMKSVAGAMFFASLACSNYLSGLMITVVHRTTGKGGRSSWLAGDLNEGRVDLFFFLLAIVEAVNFACFVACAKWFRYKGAVDDRSEISLQVRDDASS